MTNNRDKINQLHNKLEILLKRQDNFSREIDELRIEINRLETTGFERRTGKEEKVDADHEVQHLRTTPEPARRTIPFFNKPLKIKSDLEKFIGENLISKIGISILVIGVGIGAKYAIDHQLISPVMRIILGYLVGAGLLGFAIKLKKKFEDFSAVLLGGSMATMYFITYAAYRFYDLVPNVVAFILMVLFTAFTVAASFYYNRQVIALIGLVGAYAIPFLLSEGSGNVTILFIYVAIINVGILVIAFKKYWKAVYYSSFGLTWLIFLVWYVFEYQTSEHFGVTLSFLSIFFATFYLTFLAYKLLQNRKFEIGDIILLLGNSFIFYGVGYNILNDHESGMKLLGLFTLCNAVIHFIFSVIIYRRKLDDQNLFSLVSGLVLIFLTIAIPVQLKGNWVTLLWAGEAALLFWIGRTKNVQIYEILSYPVMILAFFSIILDWNTIYDSYYTEGQALKFIPLFNINFLTSLLFIGAFGFINVLDRSKKFVSALVSQKEISGFFSFSIGAILIVTIYYAFRMEIANYWNQLYTNSAITINSEGQDTLIQYRNNDLSWFKTIWIINYSLLFVSLLAFVNFKKLKNHLLGLINLGLIALILAVFLTQGLYFLSELQESYMELTLSQYYQRGVFNIGIRYISYAFVSLTLIACYKYMHQDFMQRKFKMAFDILLHITVLWIASSEFINWMVIAESTESNKLGLSILWGIYSLFLIVLGIWKKKKHLRIGAIVLFSVTLLKLFFYDISHLDTIAKTIVFISLGILLLIISFLYHKFRHIISDEADN